MNVQPTSIFFKILAALKNPDIHTIVNEGGTSCFSGRQHVVTLRGNIPISEITPGDYVKSHNETTKKDEWKCVTNVFKYKNTKPTLKITLKNGQTIVATEDHKIYHEGGCNTLKHILYLKHGNKMGKDTRL